MTDRSIVIAWIGGNCPVQAEGTIGGEPFYFRARDERWTIAIGGDVVENTFGRGAADQPSWLYEEEYSGGPSAAGWMTENEARTFIEEAAQRYFSEK